ncbi:hypothetical protein [Stenotrophomonas tumulicola]|uniref:Secreted protein n=1 Tax=Stenotrophomonas tumulicola TaxID=1685415 RepID=A0A7W3FL59_9GAMM|nr:hypothetical protein [Stenotrophomonas tumulicola]MBA8681603.1 hypothetical protein [Stenotrophomonas tumulicola]
MPTVPLKHISLAFLLHSIMMGSPASAATSHLKTIASASTIVEAKTTAKRFLAMQCNLMFGMLLGAMEVTDIIDDAENNVVIVSAEQACSH